MAGVNLKVAATNVEDFMFWARSAKYGDWCIYHTGQLALDRAKKPDLGNLAELVAVLDETKFVINTQSKAPGNHFTYMATCTGIGYIDANHRS